jgi:hypothetical protein
MFRHGPAAVRAAEDAFELEGFHQELIGRHIERPLRSRRVMLDVASGASLAADAGSGPGQGRRS